MNNKEKYSKFIDSTYVPIFSKPWWLDVVCESSNWDVWLYESGDEIWAAMPYYFEYRNNYKYITKPKLTQNNGIIFRNIESMKFVSKQAFEEKVIDSACEFIKSLELDVYEQQFHYSFNNWLPFFWNEYTEITRYTYVIDDINDIGIVWNNISSKYKNKIRKCELNTEFRIGGDSNIFYDEHRKVFERQGLNCPFSLELWINLYNACKKNNSGEILYAINDEKITSLLFLVWDDRSVYQLLGGTVPEHKSYGTYDALIWEGIKFAYEKRLIYDFEGSVIKRISKSFREFGGMPKPYFRIRKVFNRDIIQKEAEDQIKLINR